MNIKYFNNIDKVEYYDLDKWINDYLETNNRQLLKKESILVEVQNLKNKDAITIRINDNFYVCISLYIEGKIKNIEYFKYGSISGIGEKFIKMLIELKKAI